MVKEKITFANKKARLPFHLLISNNSLDCRRKPGSLPEAAWTRITNISICKCHFSLPPPPPPVLKLVTYNGLIKSALLELFLWQIFEEHRSTSALKTQRETDRETNLERSAAAGPFPLCRTAHASFDPENYLKSTEGHFRGRV